MASRALVLALFIAAIATVSCNQEGDILYEWKTKLADPNNVLSTWDPTLVNPCTWFHVTCNSENLVTRVDLGNANLSGPLVPQLGFLSNLQYLEVFANNLSGVIPRELGNLSKLVSLDLYQNEFSGIIPDSLGNLMSLRFMRLNSNKLSGDLPTMIIDLIHEGRLQILNVSDNMMAGRVKATNSTGFAITTIIQDPKAQEMH